MPCCKYELIEHNSKPQRKVTSSVSQSQSKWTVNIRTDKVEIILSQNTSCMGCRPIHTFL